MLPMYIFNPEHDLCLANGDIHFVPPESALAFGRDCASLVKFMQGLDKEVDADMEAGKNTWSGENCMGSRSMGSHAVEDIAQVNDIAQVKKIVPWGWNSVLRNRLVKQGYSSDLLPTIGQIAQITELSHRSVALEALEYVNGVLDKSCSNVNMRQEIVAQSDYRIAAKSVEEVEVVLERCRNVVLKAPLSGSGKGIRFVSGSLSHSDAGWCRNLIARHGYVVVEQRVLPVLEFAMLFRSCAADRAGDVSGVQFLGYSLFYTQNGAYRGNILASNEFIEKQISRYIPAPLLEKSRLAIMEFLKEKIADKYEGFIGVDQFVYTNFNRLNTDSTEYLQSGVVVDADAGIYRFNPVVEINLRMTMGLVARNIYDRFSNEYNLQDGSHIFEICRNVPKIGKYTYKIDKTFLNL